MRNKVEIPDPEPYRYLSPTGMAEGCRQVSIQPGYERDDDNDGEINMDNFPSLLDNVETKTRSEILTNVTTKKLD